MRTSLLRIAGFSLPVGIICLASMASAVDRFDITFSCVDVTHSELDHLGRDPATGQLPDSLPLASALSLLDQDVVSTVAFSRLVAVSGKEAAANSTHKAVYLEQAADGSWEQKTSDWDEGVSLRVTPTVDNEGRVRIDGEYSLRSIDRRAPLLGLESVPLGRPITHSNVRINPAVVMRPGEARLIGAMGDAGADRERILIVVVRPITDDQ